MGTSYNIIAATMKGRVGINAGRHVQYPSTMSESECIQDRNWPLLSSSVSHCISIFPLNVSRLFAKEGISFAEITLRDKFHQFISVILSWCNQSQIVNSRRHISLETALCISGKTIIFTFPPAPYPLVQQTYFWMESPVESRCRVFQH